MSSQKHRATFQAIALSRDYGIKVVHTTSYTAAPDVRYLLEHGEGQEICFCKIFSSASQNWLTSESLP